MFYDRFKELCDSRPIKPSVAAEEMGFNKSTVSAWKRNGTTPNRDILAKIADYFGVSVDYLITGQEQKEKAPDLTEEDERDIAKMLDGMLGQLGDQNAALAFDGEPVDEETRELLKISLENQFRLAKQLMQQRKNKG